MSTERVVWVPVGETKPAQWGSVHLAAGQILALVIEEDAADEEVEGQPYRITRDRG